MGIKGYIYEKPLIRKVGDNLPPSSASFCGAGNLLRVAASYPVGQRRDTPQGSPFGYSGVEEI